MSLPSTPSSMQSVYDEHRRIESIGPEGVEKGSISPLWTNLWVCRRAGDKNYILSPAEQRHEEQIHGFGRELDR